MDPSTKVVTYLAPGALSSASGLSGSIMRLPEAEDTGSAPWPDPDDHIVEPGSRQEMWRGELIELSPAHPGHGDTHTRLDRVVGQYAAEGYITSTDLLTRRSEDSDFATDTSVRKEGKNHETGYRYLEELCFEVFHSQSHSYASRRARDLISSGVRRLFGLFVRPVVRPDIPAARLAEEADDVTISVEEWSAERDDWIPRDAGSYIHDPCLVQPLAVKALIDATAADNACAHALIAKRNAVIEELELTHQQKGKDEGVKIGARAVVSRMLAGRFGELPEWASRRIAKAELDEIQRWTEKVFTAGSLEELMGEELMGEERMDERRPGSE